MTLPKSIVMALREASQDLLTPVKLSPEIEAMKHSTDPDERTTYQWLAGSERARLRREQKK